MGTFRLFKGELKKIFLGPGIFFMTAFLILVLTIAPKLFDPTPKKDISTSVSISTINVESAYSSFLDNKTDYESKLNIMLNNVEDLINNKTDFKQNLTTLTEEIQTLRANLDTLIIREDLDNLSPTLVSLIEKSEQLNNMYVDYTTAHIVPLVLVDENLNADINFDLSQLLKILNKDGNKANLDYYISISDALDNYRSTYTLRQNISKVKNLNYSSENLQKNIDKYYTSKQENKTAILTEITKMANEASADEEYNITETNIKNINKLSYKYLAVDNSSYYALENSLYLEAAGTYSDAEISQYVGFENFNSYKYKENITKYYYLLNNEMSDADFATMFCFNTCSSNVDPNAFDYMYFTLEIASFFIIAFTVILGAGMVAKEFSEGTIKLLAIRPFKRNKIITSKIWATMFLAFIFVLVCVVVSLITGWVLYGISFPSMLIVFNSSYAFTLPIWAVFLIYLLCMLIEIWIFALLAISISTIFKSYIAAVCISSGIYILNLILTFVSKGANWLKYNIFANLDLFKYLGGSFNASYTTNQNLTSLFISPVFADTSVIFSAIVIGALAIVMNIILYTVFKHRDITC